MTSPDFMYPQPTDDELAAQQPRMTAPRELPAEANPAHVDANTSRLGRAALVVGIVAAGLSLLASLILGVTVGPMEAEHGRYFDDAPAWYRNAAIALFGLQALCTALGITGLIMGIVAAATGRGRTQAIVAMAITVLAPFVSFGIFVILSFAFA